MTMSINYPIQANLLYIMRVLVFLMLVVHTLFSIHCFLIVINFAEMFSFNLASIQNKLANDTWLQARCKEREFLDHMRHHIHICETVERQVERQAQTNAYFVAIQQTWDERPWFNRRTALSSATRMLTNTTYETNAYDLLIKHTKRILRREIRRSVERQVERQAQTNAYFVAIQQTWDERPWFNRRTALSSATRMFTSTTYETNAYYLLIKHTIRNLRREIRRSVERQVERQAQTNAYFVEIQQTALSSATRMLTRTTYETNAYYLLIKHTIIILRREIRRLLKIRNFI
jgi:hypothetical protein